VRSINNKIDELAASVSYDNVYRECCAILLTETWLTSEISDACVAMDNFSLVRGDRTEESGKSRGGGVCAYINNQWCTIYGVKHSSCTPDVEILCVQCRPTYLPREICCVALIVVYIPPSGDANRAKEEIAAVALKRQREKPDATIIITGDFNGATLKDSLPSYVQYVDFNTRGNNSLDLFYCNIKKAYKAVSLPPIAQSDHCMVQMLPTYIRKLE
jgi:ribosome assembly protein 1